jgi:phosphatidylserine decarboxylase
MLPIMSLWWLLGLVPKNLLSRLVGRLVALRLPPPLRGWAIGAFARHFKIRLDEAEHPIEHYQSIGALFTRRLKRDLRPISEQAMVHPVDGLLTLAGPIDEGRLIQAKGLDYTLKDFLQDEYLVYALNGGWFATYYLCPTDYHRVHSPWDGEITHVFHLPGTLWPVNPWSVAHVPKLFAINERLHFIFKTKWGPAVLAMVGATNVGKMTTDLAPKLVTNRARRRVLFDFDEPARVWKGDELGIFHMGSTVVLLMPKGARDLVPALPVPGGVIDRPTRMGGPIQF